jgi:hypothetical protein
MYLENLWIHCENIYTKYTFLRTSYYRLRDCLRDRLRLPPTGPPTGVYNESAGAGFLSMLPTLLPRLPNHEDDAGATGVSAGATAGATVASVDCPNRFMPKNPPRFVRILDFRLRRVFRIYYT